MAEDIAYIKIGKPINLAEGVLAMGNSKGPDAPKMELAEVNLTNYQELFNSSPILFWGENNDYPQLLDTAAKKVGILQQGLNRLNKYCYNQGIFLYKVLETEGDTQKINIVSDKVIEAFLSATKIMHYLQSAINDYWRFGNVFTMYQMNAARKIVRLRTYDAPFCRLEKQHPKTGRTENLYVSSQWRNMSLPTSDIPDSLKGFLSKYPLLDQWDLVEQMRLMDGDYNFAHHTKFITSGGEYGVCPWHAVYENEWLNISSSVPKLKVRLFMYAMTLNYVVYIDDDYWTTVFGTEFLNWKPALRQEKVKEVQEAIERDLIGKEKSWKSLFASIKYTGDGKEKKSIIVEAIDNKLREGTFIPDNMHANGEILVALGLDPCLIGASVLGSKISAGSGSNIREAYLHLISTMRPDRDLLLEPLRVVQQYNGWDPDICFGFRDYIINTLDGRAPNSGKTVENA